jgi:sulfonate transport system ATP-binding protein
MGRSGSGKTTLLKLACALLSPRQGRVLRGSKVLELGSVRGVVFHEETLLPWLRVLDNVLLALPRGSEASDRAVRVLQIFGLGQVIQCYPYELSAGMRKRVEFARAVLSDNEILLADEPFVSLDGDTRRHFWSLWRNFDAIKSRTRLIVTHDVDEVQAIADEVIILGEGRPVSVQSISVKKLASCTGVPPLNDPGDTQLANQETKKGSQL